MTPEKEMQAFCELVRINTARIHERLDNTQMRAGWKEGPVIRCALAMAWRHRGLYEPTGAWISWFGSVLNMVAADHTVNPSTVSLFIDEEMLLLRIEKETLLLESFTKKPKVKGIGPRVEFAYGCSGVSVLPKVIPVEPHTIKGTPSKSDLQPPESTMPLHRYTKDCPPCWRCRYFDGWLPVNEAAIFIHAKAALEPEIAAALLRLDTNKVRIAKWVRSGGYDSYEKDDQPVFDRGEEACFLKGMDDGD
jgi:hypothetical protein